jgi:hypothetical protein
MNSVVLEKLIKFSGDLVESAGVYVYFFDVNDFDCGH